MNISRLEIIKRCKHLKHKCSNWGSKISCQKYSNKMIFYCSCQIKALCLLPFCVCTQWKQLKFLLVNNNLLALRESDNCDSQFHIFTVTEKVISSITSLTYDRAKTNPFKLITMFPCLCCSYYYNEIAEKQRVQVCLSWR